MPSDLCMFDESLFPHSSSEMALSGSDMIFDSNTCFSRYPDPLVPSRDIDFDDPDFLDQFIAGSNLGIGYGDFSGFDVKTEELCCEEDEHVAKKTMQRSFSSNVCSQTQLESIGGALDFQNQALRKACSTGDLQNTNTIQPTERASSSSFLEESSFDFKVGRYSAEEKKRRILKYKAKRKQRNFNKTIKYACRKTLADNRPRIRGRFARNDDTTDVIPKSTSYSTSYREDGFPLDGLVEVGRDQSQGAFMELGEIGSFMSHYGQLQYYYGY